ncbi:MAG: PA14 domain-containing protein, partial [Planctomycetia bacterium]
MRQPWTSAWWKVAVVAAAMLAIGGAVSGSEAQARPIVPGFERFGRHAADGPGRIEAGIVLIGELGCANCHVPSQPAAAHLMTKTGPVLTGVGNRIRPEWFREHLLDPQAGTRGVTMPKPLAGLPEAERNRRLTAITHYLASTGTVDEGGFAGSEQADGKQGRTVHDAVGCAACHGRLGAEPALPDAVPLGDLAAKWTPRGLDGFLKDPLAVRPASRMPRLPLGDGDRRHLVAALLGPLPAAAAVDAGIVAFRGRSWPTRVTTLPAASTLGEPEHAALVKGFDVATLAGRRNDFVAYLDGFLHVRRAGTHRFYLSSDDGSRLVVKETTVVDNDGVHPHTERQGAIDLAVGVHPIRIEYFEAGGQQSLTLDVAAPGVGRISGLGLVTPAADGTPHAPAPVDDPDDFRVEPALAAEGRTAFVTSRCAACHVLEDEQRSPLQEPSRPAALESLAGKAAAGCLAPAVGDGGARVDGQDTRVDYGLDDAQREAIAQALSWLASPAASRPPDDPQAIDRTLTALNCYACHTRAATPDGPAKGGVVPAVATVDEDG